MIDNGFGGVKIRAIVFCHVDPFQGRLLVGREPGVARRTFGKPLTPGLELSDPFGVKKRHGP
jgi:hypothetical protein